MNLPHDAGVYQVLPMDKDELPAPARKTFKDVLIQDLVLGSHSNFSRPYFKASSKEVADNISVLLSDGYCLVMG